MTRRQALLGLAGFGVGGSWYARAYEPYHLEVTHKAVKLSRLATGTVLRVLHLSDFHLSRVVPLTFIDEALARCAALAPDLICLTGDFITHELHSAFAYQNTLRRLASLAPCFACLGNHDGGAWAAARGGYQNSKVVQELLAASNITCLCNDAREVVLGAQRLRLTGLGDWWAGDCNAPRAFQPEASDVPHIVLSHNPDTKALLENYAWDLLLCGHTHGGQIVVPFFGAPLAPVRDKRYVQGLHAWRGRQIHITRGIGNVYGIRCNCPPEISLLQLTA